MSLLESLPVEILEDIFSPLKLSSIAACELTCRCLRAVISQSVKMRYIKELRASHRLEQYSVGDETPYFKRIETLRASEDPWRSLSLTKIADLPPLPNLQASGASQVFDVRISGGYLIRGWEPAIPLNATHYHENAIAWNRLPSLALQSGSIAGAIPDGYLEGSRFCEEFVVGCAWYMDPARDLLLAISDCSYPPEFRVTVYVASARTGAPHSEALRPSYPLESHGPGFSVSSALYGDLVAVLHGDGHLVLLNWRTGWESEFLLGGSSGYSPSIGFLSSDVLFLLRLDVGAIELRTVTPASTCVLLLFPTLKAGGQWVDLRVLSGHSGIFESPKSWDPQTTNPVSLEESILVLGMRLRDCRERPRNLVIDTAAILDISRPHFGTTSVSQGKFEERTIDWEDWGVRHARFIDIAFATLHTHGRRIIADEAGYIVRPSMENVHKVTLWDFSRSACRHGAIAANLKQEYAGQSDHLLDDPPRDQIVQTRFAPPHEPTSPFFRYQSFFANKVQSTLPYWYVVKRFVGRGWEEFLFNESRLVTHIRADQPQVYGICATREKEEERS